MDEAIRKGLNFGWVVEGEVAGMAFPPSDVWPLLKEQGVGAVLTLTGRTPPTDPAAHDLQWHHLPIVDFGVPDLEALDGAIRWMEQQVEAGRPVVVHCAAGMGRTGLVLASYLVARGLKPSEAVREVRRVRPGSVETRDQASLVEAYGAHRADADRAKERE